MADCKTCGVHIGEDGRRKDCDAHRELRGGHFRRKGWTKEFFQKKKPKYDTRMTRRVGSGFSEHMRTHPKTGEPFWDQERTAVRKEKRRVLNAKKLSKTMKKQYFAE